ncbi:MAG: GNAT family N-acetyltransferase [Acidobacteriota bacterium]
MQTIIRRAGPEDSEAIAALVATLIDYFLADPADRDSAADFFATITHAAYRERLEDPSFIFHLAEVARGGTTTLAGVVGMRERSHLYHLFVAETYHRQGLAARLWHTAREAAEAAGHDGGFTVNSSIYAQPVYERFGFRATGEVVHQDGIAFVPMALGPGT